MPKLRCGLAIEQKCEQVYELFLLVDECQSRAAELNEFAALVHDDLKDLIQIQRRRYRLGDRCHGCETLVLKALNEFELPSFNRTPDTTAEAIKLKGLQDVVISALLERPDGCINRPEAG